MSANSARGHVAFGFLSAPIGDGTFNPASITTWNSHKILQGDVGIQEFTDQLPQEIGAGLYGGGLFRLGAFGAGGFVVHPRLSGSICPFLHAAGGKYTFTAAAGGNSPIHKFEPADDDSVLPWLVVRKYVPNSNPGSTGLYEYVLDSFMAGLTINMPALGLMSAQFTVAGRKPVWVTTDADTVPVTNDDNSAVATSVGTTVTLGAPLNGMASFSGAQVIFVNQPNPVQEDMVLGSPYPDRMLAVGRTVAVRLVAIWNSYDSYLQIMKATAGAHGAVREWQPLMTQTSLVIDAKSPSNVPTFTNRYSLKLTAPAVQWQISPPTLTATRGIRTEMVGVIVRPSSGNPWTIEVANDKPTYGYT